MKKYFVFSVKDIVEIAMLVAVAIVLDLPFLKIRIGSNGGSISFSVIPLFILAYRKGFFKGFIGIGVVYGLLTCLIDGWGFQTYPFDYLLGYGSLSLVGLFSPLCFPKNENKYSIYGILFVIISILVASVCRLLFSTISGIIFYELNFISSLAYNSLYILPSSGIAIAVIIVLYKPILSVNRTFIS